MSSFDGSQTHAAPTTRIVQAAALYFALVFGAGFVLGTVRVLLLVPALGDRTAELIEMPVMLAIVVLAARFVRRRFAGLGSGSRWLAVGVAAFALLLVADLAVGVGLRGMTVWAALFDRDPISGTAYYGALVLFALIPWLVNRASGTT